MALSPCVVRPLVPLFGVGTLLYGHERAGSSRGRARAVETCAGGVRGVGLGGGVSPGISAGRSG